MGVRVFENRVFEYPTSKHLGIYDRYEYVLKDLPMGRALVAVSRVTGGGYDPLKRQKETDPPYLVFSNVDCLKDDHILEYANRYGLPFNPNQLYEYSKEPAEAASRAASTRASYGHKALSFEELLRGDIIPCEDFTEHYERMGLEHYRKTAKGAARALVYPLDDFWYEVDQMRRLLDWKGVIKGNLPSSDHAPGEAVSAEYLSNALNNEIAGLKTSTFVGYKPDDKIGEDPAILPMFVPIDLKQALYAGLLQDVDAAPVSRCEYRRCGRFYIVHRYGKVYCSKKCQNKACRMRSYDKKKGGTKHGKAKRER